MATAKTLKLDASAEDELDELALAMLSEMYTAQDGDMGVVLALLEKAAGGGVKDLAKYKYMPVGPREFVESPSYMNKPGVLWPGVMDAMEELNSGKYIEAVLTGAIGTAKTTLALYSTAYQIYLLSCMRNPHTEFGLDPSSEIVTIFQSISKALAQSVDYTRFRDMIEQAPYFQSRFSFRKDIESEIQFPNRIVVKPVAGTDTAAIGANVIGGVIDEINFMAKVENSKKMHAGGEQGTYDQAIANYNALARRRESRFMKKGALPGLLCLVSSRNYPGQFTDKKEAEAKKNPRIYVYDKRAWEVKPKGSYNEERFTVFVGDATRRPRIIEANEQTDGNDKHLMVQVPTDFKGAFEADMLAAIRDIAGHSTYALHPFILDTEKISAAFGKRPSVLSAPDCDFVNTQVAIYPKAIQDPKEPRFVHMDLSLTGDSAGMACGYVKKFIEVQRSTTVWETMPLIAYDFILEVKPPKGGEIIFDKMRKILYMLRDMSVNIRWVTLDSFQSRDSIQQLRQQKIMAGMLSVDTDLDPYLVLKSAVMDGRIEAPKHDRALSEMQRLEFHVQEKKIDHPPAGSKDCTDAMAGVAFGLMTRKEVWARHKVLAKLPTALRQTKGLDETKAA